MAFCQNCGKELAEGAKFCPDCGTAVNGAENKSARKQEYVGTVKKCPHCGAEVPSLTGTCPSCGHELNETRIDSSIKEFFEQISSVSWGNETKDDKDKINNFQMIKMPIIGGGAFALLYGFMVFDDMPIPILERISLIIGGIALLIIGIIIRRPMTQEEKKKRSIIETFVVPNNKESILEFLMMSCSQIQSGANPFTKEGQTVSLWNKVWKTKIRQTIVKSELVLKDDPDAQNKIAMIKSQYKL